jgi:hypothetical protein
MPFTVSVEIPKSTMDEMKRLQDGSRIQIPLQKSLYYLANQMAVYPPKRPRPMNFRSVRQRKGFFAKLRSGTIKVPYRRTGTLGRLWTSAKPKMDFRKKSFIGEIGNATPYGQFVQDENFQAMYHQGNWQTDIQVLERSTNNIVRFFEQEFGG